MDLLFDLAIHAIQVCLTLILPRAPHKLIRSRKERQSINALVRLYTPLSDLRVPFEEKYELCFQLQKLQKLQICFMGGSDDLVSKLFHFSTTQCDMVATSKSTTYEK